MKPVQFGSLSVGDRFEADGEVWRKLSDDPVLHNAMMLARRNTFCFSASDQVTPLRVPTLSVWRRWLLVRSLRWHVAGFERWSRWSWRLARILATENTQRALMGHAATLLAMGEH